MSSIVSDAAPSVSESLPVHTIVMIEKLANEAQEQLDESNENRRNGPFIDHEPELEKQFQPKIDVFTDDIIEPKFLYTMAIILHEGYAEGVFNNA